MNKRAIRYTKARYVPIQKEWRKLRRFFRSDEVTRLWKTDLIGYMESRSQQNRFPINYKRLKTLQLPRDFDSCDWRYNGSWRKGRQPAFWDYVCHSACHWVVDMCLYIAMQAYPSEPWRIITSRKHSTVWNGDCLQPLLFDANFLALGVAPKEALSLALKGRILKPGRYLRR